MSDLVHGGMFTIMVVRVDDPNDPNFESRLAEQVARSPSFFANAPVVLDIKNCTGLATVDGFQSLRRMMKRQHMVAIGIQNGNATQVRAAMNADLAAFPPGNSGTQRRAEPARAESARAEAAPAVVHTTQPTEPLSIPTLGRSKLVTQPVRSGTQIYARGGDLIVMSAVSPGAEVIADGNVHIYGTLRGRAIAGASGDTEARIFAGKMEAELLCVAGHYLVSEAIGAEFVGHAVQVSLAQDRLTLQRL